MELESLKFCQLFFFFINSFDNKKFSSIFMKDSFHMVHPHNFLETSKPKNTEFFRCSATKDISDF